MSVESDELPAVVRSLAQQCVVVMEGRDRGSRGVESIGKFGAFASLSAWKGRVPFLPASGRESVACGDGCLELIEVQLEGRKRLPAADFANGRRLAQNDQLGEPLT